MAPSVAEINLLKKRAALPRALTYPLSMPEYRASPFSINAEGDAEIQRSESFQLMRKVLASCQDSKFCDSHLPSTSFGASHWLLHRDIIHSLIYPLICIHKRASLLASRVLCTLNSPDLELVFRGEARGVFSWLQCFIAEEEDWLYTRGCSACVVLHVMQSEPSMRLTLASVRLAKAFGGGYQEWIEAEGLSGSNCGCGSETSGVSGSSTKNQADNDTKIETAGRHDPFDKTTGMPIFRFWHQSLREAINADLFWGSEIADEIEERAARVERGFMALIAQSCALEELVATIDRENEEATLEQMQPSHEKQYTHDTLPTTEDTIPIAQSDNTASSTSSCKRSQGSPKLCFTPYHGHEGEVGIIRQSSVLAERGTKGLGSTVAGRRGWLNKVLAAFWVTLLMDAAALEDRTIIGRRSDGLSPV